MSTYYTALTRFITTLFPLPSDDTCMVLTHPTEQGYWRNYAATDRALALVEQQPTAWYISVASVDAHQEGTLRRDRAHLKTAYVVMCDDIGTKAQRALCFYSWLIETSKGNYQGGWRINPWDVTSEEGRSYYEACITALAEAGYTDPGARGAYRVMRVPGSVHKTGFVANLVSWHPERIWDLPDLMAALNVTPHVRENRGAAVDVPDGTPDAVFDWLRETGRIRGRGTQSGFYDIQCPWHSHHSDDHDTAGYSPLGQGELPQKRGFVCFHSHEHRIGDFLAWVVDQDGPRCAPDGTQEILHTALAQRAEQTREAVQHVVPDPSTLQENYALTHDATPYTLPEELPECDRSAHGGPKPSQPATLLNVEYVAQKAQLRVRKDMLHHQTQVTFNDDALNALVARDDDTAQLLRDRCTMAGIRNEGAVDRLMNTLSWREPFSPVCEWIGVRWDGVSRFENLIASVTPVEEDADIWRVYLRRWLIQACQAFHNWQSESRPVGNVLVLIGPQGCGKTMWCEALLPAPWVMTGAHLQLGGFADERDAVRKVTTTPIVELGELETTFSRSAIERLKSFLSQSADTYRMSYARAEDTHPRTTVFVATANKRDILMDETGSRRFWLVNVEKANALHSINMQQLWAEVRTWWAAREQWHLTSSEDATRRTREQTFTFVTPIQDLVDAYLGTHEGNEIPMNSAHVYAALREHGLVRNNANTQALRAAMVARLGPPKKNIQGVRRAWMVPTGVKIPSNTPPDLPPARDI